ncbi:MAG TPA: maleylpyruvate isomerase family mycothiol-dependent enzyme [Actinospica sp.]|jgi:uncharacterized protein (TIGR03083 family)|nr:maleylpyruvate isomerase family mycothiol-dependent enzyme [Actinospica sp.]
MDLSECYRAVRTRMIDFAGELSPEQASKPVPALPLWTVKDTYAHLAGVCAEVLDGALTGFATDDDTARQVADRADRSLADLCEEWAERSPEMEELLAGQYGYRYNLMSFDAWNHEQDIFGGLGLPQVREDATTQVVAELLTDRFARGWRKAELSPAVHLVAPSVDTVIGVGEPVAALRTDDFELVRMLSGRRTLSEMAALDWTGDPAGVLDRLHLFTLPAKELGE